MQPRIATNSVRHIKDPPLLHLSINQDATTDLCFLLSHPLSPLSFLSPPVPPTLHLPHAAKGRWPRRATATQASHASGGSQGGRRPHGPARPATAVKADGGHRVAAALAKPAMAVKAGGNHGSALRGLHWLGSRQCSQWWHGQGCRLLSRRRRPSRQWRFF